MLYLPGVELMIDGRKFSEDEVEAILGRVRVAGSGVAGSDG